MPDLQPCDYSISRSLAAYIVYIDLESIKIHDPVIQQSEKDAWYSSRMRWVKDITGVFGLSIADVARHIEGEISSARLNVDQKAQRGIKDRLVTFFRASNP